MAEVSEEPKFTLRLMIDDKKNKVVLAEANRDFVDVLFSLLTLPIGTIVRLLEDHRKSEAVTVGCFNNLYKSVADMGTDDFETEACKEMLLSPRSVKEVKCKRLKLNINPSDDLKFFRCCYFPACNLCSNFSGSKCDCGEVMDMEIELSEDEEGASSKRNDVDGVFVKGRSSFIITDDLKVSVGSTGLVLKTLNRLGCSDVSKLEERFLDIGLKEVMTLLECMFSSNTTLTNTFLKQQSHDVKNIQQVSSLGAVAKTDETEEPEFTLDAIIRKQDMKILYVECGEDFVDLLLTFLAVPLEYLWDTTLGCIGNLRRSYKDLSVADSDSKCVLPKCVLPYYYKCKKQFSNITTEEAPDYFRHRNAKPSQPSYSLTTDPDRILLYRKDRLVPVTLIDPKSHGGDQSEIGNGFVKRGTRFTVSDDLVITPRDSLSTSICFLKKLQIQADDLDVQVITIRKAEAMSLLKASLVTTSALNTALWNLIAKKPKEEQT